MDHHFLKSLWFFRISLGVILLFEMLNWAGVLQVPLDFSWHGLIITAVLAWFVTEMVMRYEPDVQIGWVLPLIVLLVYMDALGDIFHLYSTIHPYDKFLHFTGSSIVTYAVYELFRKRFVSLPKALSAMVYISLGSTVGMLYEIEEYLEDLLVNHRLLRMGDSFDTGWDLLMDFLGCMCIVLILLYWERRMAKEKPP